MSTAEVVPVFRDLVHLRSHTDACNHGVRVGKREFPKGKPGCCCLEEQKGKWVEGRAGTKSPLQSSPPPSHTCSLCWCPGEGVVPASFQPSQGGTRKEHLVPLGQLTEVSFLPRKPPHHNLCLCLHRIFSLLFYMETLQR